MHLPDARRRERIALPLREDLSGWRAEVLADDLDRRLRRQRRRLLLQARQDALELLLVAGRREAIDVRRHLPELERQALHLAERLQHRLGGLLRALQDAPARLELFLFGAARAHGAAHGLGRDRQGARRERSEPREAAEARGGRRARDAEPAAVQRCGGRSEATTTS